MLHGRFKTATHFQMLDDYLSRHTFFSDVFYSFRCEAHESAAKLTKQMRRIYGFLAWNFLGELVFACHGFLLVPPFMPSLVPY